MHIVVKGMGPIGGTFRLSFRGSVTEAISVAVTSNDYTSIKD
jgi:hypothetical protein